MMDIYIYNKINQLFIFFINNRLKKALGSQAHICVENKELPKIIKSLFLASMVKA